MSQDFSVAAAGGFKGFGERWQAVEGPRVIHVPSEGEGGWHPPRWVELVLPPKRIAADAPQKRGLFISLLANCVIQFGF
jgi:hypothetical protein